jgi:sirohydrochlorin cobaltochelatase
MMSDQTSPALILFAHGARDPEWSRPIEQVRDAVLAHSPNARVAVAFLEFMTPDLDSAVSALVGQGAQHITVVPVFIAQGGHLKLELPRMVEALRSAYPGVHFELTPPVGQASAVIQAMAVEAQRLAGLSGGV